MIQLVLQLVFLPLRLFIDFFIGCFLAVISILTLVLFGLAILSATGVL